MKIECLIRREGGSHVNLPLAGEGETVYHFRPDNALYDYTLVPHVCEVDNEAHIARFVSEALPDYKAVPDPTARAEGLTLVPTDNPEKAPTVPAAAGTTGAAAMNGMSDEAYMMLASQLPGMENHEDPNALVAYLQNHYGVTADPALGVMALVKQIITLQQADEAERP